MTISNSNGYNSKIFFPNLDGLRFFCFLSVFFFHSFYTEFAYIKQSSIYTFVKYTLFGNGDLGVNCFFVLSGFLISYLLFEEKNSMGKIDLKKFYIRRILRIWPLFYFCIFFGFCVFPFLKGLFGGVPSESADLPYYLLFLNNLNILEKGLPDASILGVLWSVAIEEQFYLVWPVLLLIFPKKKHLYVFLSVIVLSVGFRTAYLGQPEVLKFHTLSVISDMAIGGLAAHFSYYSSEFVDRIRKLPGYTLVLLYISLTAIFLFRQVLFALPILIVLERLIISILFALLILEQNYSERSFFKFSNFKMVSNLGKITYGLYCLHFIGILTSTTLTKKLGMNTQLWEVLLLDTAIALAITIVISTLSYRYFEKPFLKLKRKFSTLPEKQVLQS